MKTRNSFFRLRRTLSVVEGLVLVLIFSSCQREISLTDPAVDSQATNQEEILHSLFHDFTIVTIDAATQFESMQSVKEGQAKSLQLAKGENKFYDLTLIRNNVVEEMSNDDGSMDRMGEMPQLLTFEGFQNSGGGEPARLTMSKEFLSGFVTEGGEQFYIEPLRFYVDGAPDDQYLIYAASAVVSQGAMCGVGEEEMKVTHPEDLGGMGAQMPALCRKVEVRASCDYPFYQNAGYNVSTAIQRMATTLNNADALYAPLGIDLVTTSSSFAVRTTPDSYSVDAQTMLNQFTNAGNAGAAYQRDVWVLFTRRNITYQGNPNIVGLAWTGVVCRNQRYSYLVVETTISSILTLVTAHELGHSLGAQHVGSCPGGIMYPSSGGSCSPSYFHSTSINQIKGHINTYGTCLSSGNCQ